MRWMTLSHLHLDRVASAWLIARFIDPDAEFEYLDWEATPPSNGDATLFGVPGAEFGPPDERGTCFAKLLRARDIDDEALVLLERLVAAGVANAHGKPLPGDLPADLRSVGVALDLLGIGFGVLAEDSDHLASAMPMYDALYRLCQSRTLPEAAQANIPRLPGERARFLRSAIAGRT
jgi:hypothetical protein